MPPGESRSPPDLFFISKPASRRRRAFFVTRKMINLARPLQCRPGFFFKEEVLPPAKTARAAGGARDYEAQAP